MARASLSTDSVKATSFHQQALALAADVEIKTETISEIFRVIDKWINHGNYEVAKVFLKKMEALCKDENMRKEEGSVYNLLGKLAYQEQALQDAMAYFRQGKIIHEELGDTLNIAICSHSIAAMHFASNQYVQAMEAVTESLRITELMSDKKRAANDLSLMGIIYDAIGEKEKALDYLLQAEKMYTKGSDSMSLAITLTNTGKCFSELGMHTKALTYYQRALRIFEQANYVRAQISVYSSIGRLYESLQQDEKALESFARSKELSKALGDKENLFGQPLSLGRIYRRKGQIDLARKIFTDLLIDARKSHYFYGGSMAADELYQLELSLGNYGEALKAHTIFKEMSDSLRNKENTKKILLAEEQYQFRKEKDQLQFENEREKLILNQQIQEQQAIQYGSIAGILLLLVIIYILYRFYTAKQKANLQLQQQRDEITAQKQALESLDRTKSRFFANVSHELRTPLTLAYAPLEEVIQDHTHSLPDEVIQKVALAKQNTYKLKHLVDDILNLTKLDAQKIGLNPSEVPVQGFISRIFGAFESMAAYRGIDYTLNVDALPEDHQRIDADKLEKVINNLLSNALKYTPTGGKVSLAAQQQGEHLQVQISDTGSGISQEDLPYIFDRYFQSKQPDAPIQGGTGIGLAMAKEYVQLMGGRIQVESQVGKGSMFTVLLPYKKVVPVKDLSQAPLAATSDEEILLPVPSRSGTQQHVLIVEDQPDMLHYIQSLLQKSYTVSTAMNGKEALAVLAQQPIDLIVSDVMMPEMDGFELLKAIRAHEVYASLPVIMLTALSDEAYRLEALTLGVDDYLPKPFSVAELVARTQNMLARYEVRKQTVEEVKALPIVNLNHEEELLSLDPKLTASGKAFVQKAEAIIQAEIENEDFSLVQLADHFCLSYSQFSRKVKLLTGLSPKQFQREVAMQKARRLLESGQYANLTGVAYSVGISHVTRFSKMYEKRFGKNPAAYFEGFIKK
ncbi:MAG: response regulator [Bacteroidota bacterium]